MKQVDVLVKTLDIITNNFGCSVNNYDRVRGPIEGSYPFVPMPTHKFISLLLSARKLAEFKSYNFPTFLDAGCGIGMTVALAFAAGFKATGLELNNRAITLSKKMLRRFDDYRCVKKQNILTYKEYGNYDVIYYWLPFFNKNKQAKMERLIADQMKVGGIVLPCGSRQTFHDDHRFRRLDTKPKNSRHWRHDHNAIGGTSIYRKMRA